MLRTYWTNFAKTGDPNGPGLPQWPAYDEAKPLLLHIESGNTKAGPLVNEKGLQVLDAYFASRRTEGQEVKPEAAPAGGLAAKGPFFGEAPGHPQ
jgi:para-nitrobenzyl esterase